MLSILISLKNYGLEIIVGVCLAFMTKNFQKSQQMLSMKQTGDGATNISKNSVKMGWTFSF